VIYVRLEDIIKAKMAEYVPLHTRLAMHSANCELNKLLCVMASGRAGYHIEELTQVGRVQMVGQCAAEQQAAETFRQLHMLCWYKVTQEMHHIFSYYCCCLPGFRLGRPDASTVAEANLLRSGHPPDQAAQ
jgi:hypothetical protein